MIIVWDEPKRLRNIERHGLDFRDAERIVWAEAMIERSYPGPYGRPRYRAVGVLDDDLVTVVFALLGSEGLSLISLRPASRKERKQYAER